jgi:hypothetical protein
MHLSGDFSKVSLPSLLQLARNGELTGIFTLKQGDQTASIFIEHGRLLHAESESQVGWDALLELFLWVNGSFSFLEGPLKDIPGTFLPDEPLDKVLREGFEYVEQKKYLDNLGITGKTILCPNAELTDEIEDEPLLSFLDGKKTIAQALAGTKLSRRVYIQSLYRIISNDLVEVVPGTGMAPPAVADEEKKQATVDVDGDALAGIDLPAWVVARLLQENPDLSKAIVDLVVWADRVKCWLYQADAELVGVIDKLEKASDEAPGEEDAQSAEKHKQKQRKSKLGALIAQVDESDDESELEDTTQVEEQSKSRTSSKPPSIEF